MPERSKHHPVSRFVQTVRKTGDGYQIVPVAVMTKQLGKATYVFAVAMRDGETTASFKLKAGADATGGDPPGVGVGVGAGGGSITSSSVSTTRSGSQRS